MGESVGAESLQSSRQAAHEFELQRAVIRGSRVAGQVDKLKIRIRVIYKRRPEQVVPVRADVRYGNALWEQP